jgi:hypothetical protein
MSPYENKTNNQTRGAIAPPWRGELRANCGQIERGKALTNVMRGAKTIISSGTRNARAQDFFIEDLLHNAI